jgi:CheY-like chemotaxis protein
MVARSSESLRIVVVDDDPQIREIVGRCLVLFGASVTLCEDVLSAVESIKKVRPDVVLVDLIMPGLDGFDLLDQIRSWGTELGGDVPVIVTTGLRDPDLESKARKVGVVYLAKPFTPIKLFNSITDALGSLPSLKRRWSAFPMLVNSGS